MNAGPAPLDESESYFDNDETHTEDWFLQNLVSIANTTEADQFLPVTLLVKGAILSGHIVGGKKYFQLFADQLVAGWDDGPDKDQIRRQYSELGNVYGYEGVKDVPPPSFIHLRDANLYFPGGGEMPGNGGVLWRGRLSEVSGFWLGRLNVMTSGG